MEVTRRERPEKGLQNAGSRLAGMYRGYVATATGLECRRFEGGLRMLVSPTVTQNRDDSITTMPTYRLECLSTVTSFVISSKPCMQVSLPLGVGFLRS
jgi:hypothetical protein